MDLLKNLPDATRSPSLHTPHTLPGSRPVRSILKKTEKAQVSSPGPPRALGTSVSPGHVSSVVAQGPRPPADSVYKRSCTESHQDCPGCVSVPLQQSPGCVSEPRHPQDSTTSCWRGTAMSPAESAVPLLLLKRRCLDSWHHAQVRPFLRTKGQNE